MAKIKDHQWNLKEKLNVNRSFLLLTTFLEIKDERFEQIHSFQVTINTKIDEISERVLLHKYSSSLLSNN